MWEKAEALKVSRPDRELLETLIRSGRNPQKVMLRARIVLGAMAGRSNHALAQELGVTRTTILLWRRRFEAGGVQGLLRDAPRGRPRPAISRSKIASIVTATLEKTPKDATHWSSRSLAAAQGVSQSTVIRVWQAHGLQPHRVTSFELSRDPEFASKLRDVVGLYLAPPDKAIVFCIEEKSQVQARDRTQPALQLRRGRPESRTHDYVRHGTTTLFAALNILDGTVIDRCQPPHAHVEFVAFLEEIDRATPPRRDLHLVIDNYGTHKRPAESPRNLQERPTPGPRQ